VADDQVMAEARVLAAKLMERPGIALSFAKEAIHCGVKADFNTGRNMEAARFAMCFSSSDQKEGHESFCRKEEA